MAWQGRVEGRFGIFSRRWSDGAWAEPVWVSEGVASNVWDPTLTVDGDGMAYAWSEYSAGSYAVALRRIGADGVAGLVRRLTGGSDYALHPSLATTTDGRLWCAFDVITMHGHGGSGPTRLRPRPGTGRRPTRRGMREPGDSVPPELLPEVSAEIRVVCVERRRTGATARHPRPGLGVAPSALPRLQATADGGLVVGYRVHRQLPLMTYYWEAAVQVLDASGWRPPITFTGTDATLEEVSLAQASAGSSLATQSDGRLERALHWTEGFGGRECPYLADHHGAVIWHGVHGAGQVVLATVETAGPAASDDASGSRRSAQLRSDGRREVRRWAQAAGGRGERYQVQADGETYQPVLGRSAPALPGQPLHLRRRAVPRGLLPLRLGRRRVRLLGGHRPCRELHRVPVVEHPEDRRPAARARAFRAVLRVRVDLGRARPPERHLRRRRRGARRSSPRSPRAAPRRTACGAGSPSTRSSPRSPSRTTPVRRWCTTTGTTTTPGTAGSSRCSRPAAATTSRRCASARTPTAPRPARS